jgi:Thioredoxin like C-terminal domain/AhpC/TSA family
MGLIRDLARHMASEGRAPSLAGATGWLNSPPLEMTDLRGRVVLVDFGTYTCINWIRTLPYVRAWEERYRDDGLVMIGIHTPEFSFEHDPENIRTALRQMHVTWPMAIDNHYGVWQAFANHYWPALYFIDAQGQIRHHRFGEGDYERSERMLQVLLGEAGVTGIDPALVDVRGEGPEAEADWGNLETRETYLGHGQTTGFASRENLAPDKPHAYEAPATLALNHWSLAGEWTVSREASTSEAPGGRIGFRFVARDVHLVMSPRDVGSRIPFRVTLEGEAPSDAHGTDVAADGSGSLVEPRMYQLIRQTGPIVDRLFEIEFLDGAQGFAFTFG